MIEGTTFVIHIRRICYKVASYARLVLFYDLCPWNFNISGVEWVVNICQLRRAWLTEMACTGLGRIWRSTFSIGHHFWIPYSSVVLCHFVRSSIFLLFFLIFLYLFYSISIYFKSDDQFYRWADLAGVQGSTLLLFRGTIFSGCQ